MVYLLECSQLDHKPQHDHKLSM